MKFYLSVFCLINVITVVKSAQLDIKPSTNIQAGAATLTVRCQPTTASGVTSVYRLDILRQKEGFTTEQILGTIQVVKQPALGPGLTSPKYTVTGSLTSIDDVSTSFVQIVIQDPDCNDKGEYVCKVTGGNSVGPLNPEKRTNVTVQENPSNLDMNVVPSRSKYELNASISMACNGNVGNPAQTWQWQTRNLPASTQWIRYTDEADMVTDPVTEPSDTSCSYRQKTVLNYTVKSQDNGLEIRCILDNREEFSHNFTIHLVEDPVTSPPIVKSAQLDISPNTNIQAGAATLTVRCQPTITSGVTSVYRLDILRLREGVSTEQSLATILVTKQPELGPGLTSPKYTVTGSLTSIDAILTSFVQIVIQDPGCNDEGEYVCRVTGGNSEGPLNPEKRTNVTVQENPGGTGINIIPSRSNSEYALNDSISLTCNGNVGNPAQTWQWQTRRFPASTQWIKYTDSADIVTGPVIPPSVTRCSYRQQTVLNYRVKSQDNGLQIRCILDNTCSEEFSHNFTIHLTGQNNGGGDGNPDRDSGSTGGEDMTSVIILGIVVVILVVYGVVISLIAVYWYRKHKGDSRRQENASTYATVQHVPTTDSVYTSLENNAYLQQVNGLK